MNLIPPSHPTPEEFVEHLVTVAGGGDDALGAGPAGSGVGAGLKILIREIIFTNNPQQIQILLFTQYTLRISG